MRETKEQFVARYPKPHPDRILVSCECSYKRCTGWAWTWLERLSSWETVVEEDLDG